MSDIVEIPITVIQQDVSVPITPGAPNIIREGAAEASAKISQMLAAAGNDLLTTDLIPVARAGVWTKKTTIATIAAFMSQVAIGAALLQEDAEALPAKVSDLAAAENVTGDDLVMLVQAGESTKASMLQLAAFIQQQAAGGYVRTPAGIVWGHSVSGAVQTANTVAIQALADEMSPENGGSGGIIFLYGKLKFHGIRLHPSVHVFGDGRYSTEFEIADNCTITTGDRRVNGVVVPGADAEARALFYCLARAPFVPGQVTPTAATDSWMNVFRDFSINGNKGNQSNNWVAGIYAENGNSDPDFDEVAPGGNAKAYSSFKTDNVEVFNCSGTGVYSAPERQRAAVYHTRSLNNGIVTDNAVVTLANGFKFMGNDCIICPRCGSGGNTDPAVEFTGPSGVNITQGNFWNGHLASTTAATAVQLTGCNGIALHGNTFNAGVYATSGANAGVVRRPVVIVGNETRVADELFPDGQPNGTPLGLGSQPWRNSAYTINGYASFCIKNNGVAPTADGKTFERLVWARGDAKGAADFTVNTATNLKPYFHADPYYAEAGSVIIGDLTDVNTGRRYMNAGLVTGQADGYHRVDGGMGLRRGVYAMTTATPLQLLGEATAKLSAGGVIDALPLRMPTPRCHDQRVEVLFRQRINALTCAITSGTQDSPSDGAALQNVVMDTTNVPAYVEAGTTIVFHYDRPTTTWSVAGIWNKYDPPNIKDPTRDFGGLMNGVMDITSQIQAAMTAAKQAAIPGFTYGLGGKVRSQVGVGVMQPVTWSRSVSWEGSGALGSTVHRVSYASLGSTPGEDALVTMLDDGTAQAGIVIQQSFSNLAFDGRRSTIAAPSPLATHIRHCLYYPEVVDGTDRVCSVRDMHIMNFPGSAWKVVKNDQVRGGNFKATGNRMGLDWEGVKDGKVDQVGVGNNDKGNKTKDCASVKIGKIDAWTGGNSTGEPVWTCESCAKFVVGEGEVEGMFVFIGDNDNNNSKAYRQVVMNITNLINFKVSEDYFAAVGAGNATTGAGYVAHVKIIDIYGVQTPGCSFGYKLGLTPTQGMLDATPLFCFWFGTKVDSGDPQYADYVEACGYVDVHTTKFLWHDGKETPGLRSLPIVAFKERVSNMDERLHGYRVGDFHLRSSTVPIPTDELPCDGATLTSNYYPLIYLALDHTRKLTDRDASGPGSDPVTGYKTFTMPTITPGAGLVQTVTYKQ